MLVNQKLLYLLLLMIQFAHQQASTSIESLEQHSVKEIIIIINNRVLKKACPEVRNK